MHRAVAEVIGSRIVRGDYPPGSLLPNEAAWAADFNVSRSAIREGRVKNSYEIGGASARRIPTPCGAWRSLWLVLQGLTSRLTSV